MNKDTVVQPVVTVEQTFAAVMGISAEREAEIDKIMERVHGDTDTYPDAIAMASKELSNPNELAYLAFHLGAFAESQRAKQELLSKLLE